MTTIAQSTDTPSRLVAKNLTLGYGTASSSTDSISRSLPA